jgi:hypothetical protein
MEAKDCQTHESYAQCLCLTSFSTGDRDGEKHMTIGGADGTGLILTREQETLLESILGLALGCGLGWQDEECYEGLNPEVLP